MTEFVEKTGKIVPLFDYYTAVWQNSSIKDVFNHYCIGELIDTFVLENEMICMESINIENWHISFNGVSISFKCYDVPTFSYDSDLSEFVGAVLPKLRFELSGKGCSYLQNECGFDLFAMLRKPLPDYAHVTRVDIAFDLIDYKPEFQRALKEFCLNPANQTSFQRLAICNLKSGTSFSVRSGDQETVYIGAPTSDKLLRVYDKFLQFQKRGRGVLVETPYGTDIKSWIRIEWQLRNKRADSILFGFCKNNFFLEVFKKIYETYKFRDISKPGCVPVDFWQDLFDWETIPSIIQNLRFVSEITMIDKIDECFERALGAMADYIMVHGRQAFNEAIDRYFHRINNPKNERDFFLRRKRIFRLNAAFKGDLRLLMQQGKIIDNKLFPI